MARVLAGTVTVQVHLPLVCMWMQGLGTRRWQPEVFLLGTGSYHHRLPPVPRRHHWEFHCQPQAPQPEGLHVALRCHLPAVGCRQRLLFQHVGCLLQGA